MNIAAEFNLGNLLTILTMIVLSVLFVSRFRTDIQILVTKSDQTNADVKEVKEAITKLSMMSIDMATHSTRMDAFDQRLTDTVKVRERMQADVHSRFEGIEERLRAVEALAHVGGALPTKAAKRKRTP